jgi:hypothetical protein
MLKGVALTTKMNRLAYSLGISGSLWIAVLFSFSSWAAKRKL